MGVCAVQKEKACSWTGLLHSKITELVIRIKQIVTCTLQWWCILVLQIATTYAALSDIFLINSLKGIRKPVFG